MIISHPNYPEYTCIKAKIDNNNGSLIKNGWKWHKQVKNIDCDVIFSPNPYLTYFTTKKIIQTIHDLQPLKNLFRKNIIGVSHFSTAHIAQKPPNHNNY